MAKTKRIKTSNHLYLLGLLVLVVAGYFTWKMVFAASTVKYVALGDSITAGAQVQLADTFVQKYANHINQDLHTDTTIVNLGVNGATTTSLLNSLQNDQNYQNNVASADVITLYIGINDFQLARFGYLNYQQFSQNCNGPVEDCLQNMVTQFNTNYSQIISTIKSLNTSEDTTIRTAILYYPFINLDGDSGELEYLKGYVELMNSHISSTSQANNLEVADLYSAINGPNHDQDGLEAGLLLQSLLGLPVHPSPQGHTLIAETFKNLGYQQLDKDSDGDADVTDNCPGLSNPDQANMNKEPIPLPSPYPYSDATNAIADNIGDLCDSDKDHDRLPNDQEAIHGTDESSPDSDNDAVLDGAEITCGSNPLDANSKPRTPSPGIVLPDTDIDLLPNSCEAAFGTSPTIKDADGDKLPDGTEALYIGTNPLSQDTDGDNCSDIIESATLNADKVVNSADQGLIAKHFNARIGQPNYIKSFDVNGDGAINSGDQLIMATIFNQRCPSPPANQPQ